MKTCKKCKNEYKDDYSFCPKCGKPYDDKQKAVKTPGDVASGTGSVLFKIWNIILYIFGGMMILGCIATIAKEPLSSIFGILFGLSLFQVFYKMVEDKFNVEEKYLKIARVVLPIVLIILFGMATPTETNETTNNNSKTNDNTTTQENSSSKNEESKETKTSEIVFLKNTKANDYYKILCDVTGLTPKSPKNILGDINEYSADDTNYMIEVGANKSTDEIAYITITTIGAQDSTNAFMALTRLDYNGKDSAKLTSFITENMGKTADITIGELKFTMWTNNGKPIIKAETPDFEKYVENM